jgi:hypothetical protein
MISELSIYKNKFINEKVLLFAAGPTLNDFKYSDKFNNYKKCGVNGTILHKDIKDMLDIFVFCGDIDIPQNPCPTYEIQKKEAQGLKSSVLKFANCWTNGSIFHPSLNIQTQMHPDEALKDGYIRYNQIANCPNEIFSKDLELFDNGVCAYSVAFAAMQILLFMGFTEIILIGFDCGGGTHSYKIKDPEKYKNDHTGWGSANGLHNNLINWWRRFKVHLNSSFPNVDVKVINPIGLKGIFEEYV